MNYWEGKLLESNIDHDKSIINVSGNASILNIIDNGSLQLPFEQDIYLYSLSLAGIKYYINNSKNDDIKLKLYEKDKVILQREPNNEYDEYAIAVFLNNKRKLGYIPRRSNKIFARLMDAGKILVGEIEEIEYWFDEISNIKVNIYLKDF